MQSEKSSISARFYWKFRLDRKATLCQDDDLAHRVSSYLQSTSKEKYCCVLLVFDVTYQLNITCSAMKFCQLTVCISLLHH